MDNFKTRVRFLCRRRYRYRELLAILTALFFGLNICFLGFGLRNSESTKETPRFSCDNFKNTFTVCLLTGFCCKGPKSGQLLEKDNQIIISAMFQEPPRQMKSSPELAASEKLHEKETLICDPKMTIAIVACGEIHLEEAMNTVQSLLMFSNCSFDVHVFTDLNNIVAAQHSLPGVLDAPVFSKVKRNLIIHEAKYPDDENGLETLHPDDCSSIRLFLPDILKNTDSIIYLDADTLFVQPVEKLWSHFAVMTTTQVAALASEHQTEELAWYRKDNPFTTFPFAKPFGVNSGVMLMNLTRMRENAFVKEIRQLFLEFASSIHLLHQDLINIYFHQYSDKLLILPCKWNFRYTHCHENICNCDSAEQNGIGLMHGGFLDEEEARLQYFRIIYGVFYRFNAGTQTFLNGFIDELARDILQESHSDPFLCDQLYTSLAKEAEQRILQLFPQKFDETNSLQELDDPELYQEIDL